MIKSKAAPFEGNSLLNEEGFLQYGNRGELRIVACIVKQEELLAALLGENFRNDGMVERFGGILRRDGARLIAIPEEMLARLLVADDADLKDAFPLFELVEGECPQEFERVVHSHRFIRFDNMGNNMICPKAQLGSEPNPARREGVFGGYIARAYIFSLSEKFLLQKIMNSTQVTTRIHRMMGGT